jgi:hypothetical protein
MHLLVTLIHTPVFSREAFARRIISQDHDNPVDFVHQRHVSIGLVNDESSCFTERPFNDLFVMSTAEMPKQHFVS